jgi:hypothetical protein
MVAAVARVLDIVGDDAPNARVAARCVHQDQTT